MARSASAARTLVLARLRPAVRLPATALLTACAMWSIARLTGADKVPLLAGLLIPVLAFTPYAAVGSLVAIVYAAALRRWAATGVAVAVAVIFAATVLPRAVGTPAPVAKGPLLRVLTANLRFGHADAKTLVDLVRRRQVDLLNVEEFTSQAAAAFDRAGLAALLPYKIIAPMNGASGSGLYSRYRLRGRPMPPLSITGLAMPHADMDVPGSGGAVEVMAVHLARPLNPAGVAQWGRGFSWLPTGSSGAGVRVIAGDFNATLDHAPLRELLRGGYVDAADATGTGLIPTFRKRLWPPVTIDHVLADARCAVRQVAVYHLPNSDHRALFAALRLP